MLPAFPVAMIIAKDVTIKVKTASGNTQSSKKFVESSSAASGGICGFRASSSNASRSSSESTFHGETADGYYIRIPGPQILGYFLQFVANDESDEYMPVTDEDICDPNKESLVLQAFHLYENHESLQSRQIPDKLLEKKDIPAD